MKPRSAGTGPLAGAGPQRAFFAGSQTGTPNQRLLYAGCVIVWPVNGDASPLLALRHLDGFTMNLEIKKEPAFLELQLPGFTSLQDRVVQIQDVFASAVLPTGQNRILVLAGKGPAAKDPKDISDIATLLKSVDTLMQDTGGESLRIAVVVSEGESERFQHHEKICETRGLDLGFFEQREAAERWLAE